MPMEKPRPVAILKGIKVNNGQNVTISVHKIVKADGNVTSVDCKSQTGVVVLKGGCPQYTATANCINRYNKESPCFYVEK